MKQTTIAIASDHAGVDLKTQIIEFLKKRNYNILDFGTNSEESVDYPDYAKKVCSSIIKNESIFGILICGTGVGMSIAANRRPGIRAALCHNEFIAEQTRKHNDANIIVLGSRIINNDLAIKCIDIFLNTEFEKERHQIRINKLEELHDE